MIRQFLLLIVSYYSYTIAPLIMDRGFMAYMLILALLSIINCYSIKEKNINIKGQYLRHSFVFLFGFIIVFYQYIIDYVLHFIESPDDVQSLIWYNQSIVCKALCLANVGLNSFLIGYLFIKCRTNIKQKDYNIQQNNTIKINSLNYLYLILLFLVIIYIITIDKNYLFNGYGKNASMGNTAFHIGIWIQGVLTAYIVMLSYTIKNNNINHYISNKEYLKVFKKPLVLCITMIILILMSGRRTEALRFMLLLGISYIYIKNIKIKLIKIIIPLIVISILFSILAFIRTSEKTTIADSLNMLNNSSSIFPATKELALNISSLHIALDNVPKHYPHLLGIPTLIGLSMLLPGFQPFILNFLDIPIIYQSSTYLICYAAFGDIRYYTLGTSILADIYINYGLLGLFFIPMLIGIILRKMENITFTNEKISIYSLGLSFCIYTQLIYMCRGTLTSPLTSVSYVLILTYLFRNKILK